MTEKHHLTDEYMGIMKRMADGYTLPDGRFEQLPRRMLPFFYLVTRTKMCGWSLKGGIYWIICKGDPDKDPYYKVPFAHNELWFRALTEMPEFAAIAELPQVFLV
jgi:hypothetical protein